MGKILKTIIKKLSFLNAKKHDIIFYDKFHKDEIRKEKTHTNNWNEYIKKDSINFGKDLLNNDVFLKKDKLKNGGTLSIGKKSLEFGFKKILSNQANDIDKKIIYINGGADKKIHNMSYLILTKKNVFFTNKIYSFYDLSSMISEYITYKNKKMIENNVKKLMIIYNSIIKLLSFLHDEGDILVNLNNLYNYMQYDELKKCIMLSKKFNQIKPLAELFDLFNSTEIDFLNDKLINEYNLAISYVADFLLLMKEINFSNEEVCYENNMEINFEEENKYELMLIYYNYLSNIIVNYKCNKNNNFEYSIFFENCLITNKLLFVFSDGAKAGFGCHLGFDNYKEYLKLSNNLGNIFGTCFFDECQEMKNIIIEKRMRGDVLFKKLTDEFNEFNNAQRNTPVLYYKYLFDNLSENNLWIFTKNKDYFILKK